MDPAVDISKAVSTLSSTISTANAVGDLASLTRRLDALGGTVSELTEAQSAEEKAASEAAVVERTAIVEAAEALAAADPAKTQWKQATAELDALFARWQTHQQEGPRIPKAAANELWKRFRAARTTIEQHRKAFFADLDSAHRDVRSRKQALIEQAEALAPKGADGIPTYRTLLDDWKTAGRAGKKQDDALWARFKAAGDVLYGAKAEVDAQENEEYSGNLTLKLALLEEAEPILAETDRTKARTALTSIQRRWDEIGKVPRDQVKVVEERLRKVEAAVRKLDDDHWKRNNPETKARTEGLAGQLNDAIAKLEADLEKATAVEGRQGHRRRHRGAGDPQGLAEGHRAVVHKLARPTAPTHRIASGPSASPARRSCWTDAPTPRCPLPSRPPPRRTPRGPARRRGLSDRRMLRPGRPPRAARPCAPRSSRMQAPARFVADRLTAAWVWGAVAARAGAAPVLHRHPLQASSDDDAVRPARGRDRRQRDRRRRTAPWSRRRRAPCSTSPVTARIDDEAAVGLLVALAACTDATLHGGARPSHRSAGRDRTCAAPGRGSRARCQPSLTR